jgi:hypothetical protein
MALLEPSVAGRQSAPLLSTNGLASTACSFILTAITPVNTTYAYERTNFTSARGPQTRPDRSSLFAGWRMNELMRSLSAA